jgi:cytochrome c biogenesis protein CcmG, thiol:disulfide interchange protein DsbE
LKKGRRTVPLDSGIVFETARKMLKTIIMKKIALLFVGLSLVFGSFSQETPESHEGNLKQLPSVQLKTMDGKTVNTAELGFNGPVVISFWATWCSPCKRELNTIHELYADWQEETGVNLVAVSIDDQKTMNSVMVYVNGKGWEYLVLMDPNGDFKRAMGVNNVPHTFLIDAEGNIVYSHNNYAPGDEEKLYEEIKKLAAAPKE